MIDSESLFRWGAGFLIGTGIIDFFRFGTFQIQSDDWLSVGMATAGLTMVTLAAIDMTLDKKMLKLNAPPKNQLIRVEMDILVF